MDYLFRGLRGVNGEPVVGRLNVPNEEAMHEVLEGLDIIAEAAHPAESGSLFPPTLQAALDEIGLRVSFNQIPKVHAGSGVWILDRTKIPGRVMQFAREVCRGAEHRQPALRRIEQLLESHYGERPASTAAGGAGAGRYASADEVQAEIRRLRTAIRSLERELTSIRSRPYAESRPAATKRGPRDRTQDDVLREIFQHNLQLMKMTREYGISGLED